MAPSTSNTGDILNWLAHVYLSEPNLQFRLGNLLADLVRGSQRQDMSPEFLRGARCHRAIDAFTDSHPVVKRSRARIDAKRRRFSGVLVDVFYDHCLATSWSDHSPSSLDEFTASFYAEIAAAEIALPEPAQTVLDRIMRHGLLEAYAEVGGVERSLRRLSMRLATRWNRNFALEEAVEDLLAHRSAFAGDFAEFFPQLQAHVAAQRF